MTELEKLQQRRAKLGAAASVMSAGCWILVLVPIIIIVCIFLFSH
jgi:hypothetical protein